MDKDESRFVKVYEGKVNGIIPLSKWKSTTSGITIYLAHMEGPVVSGYFTVVTEALDNAGLPHTLEHLVFMGSRKYPYGGMLDCVANRSLGSGTEAWTDTDHTCYTLTTSGSRGFLNVLPVYLDHILHPTLLESAYHTEVHYINGDGEDAGVVYSELKGTENTCEDQMNLALHQAMYPEGCGYRYVAGGLLDDVRSTNNDAVIAYHKSFYIPTNLHIVITGQIEVGDVLSSIAEFEDSLSDAQEEKFTRPFQTPISPLAEDTTVTVRYSSADAHRGNVHVALRAPPASDIEAIHRITTIMDYLTDTANSPLHVYFSHRKALCSQVNYSMSEGTESCLCIEFENVPVKKLTDIYPSLIKFLKRLVKRKYIDMSRMKVLIEKKATDNISKLEDEPHDTINELCMGDVLFGRSPGDLNHRLHPIEIHKRMLIKSQESWLRFLEKWFIDRYSVTVIARPSKSLMIDIGMEEKARIKHQREKLRDGGLRAQVERLEDAKTSVQRPPEDILSAFRVPSVKSIKFHRVQVYSNEPHWQQTTTHHPRFDVNHIKCMKFQLDHTHTNFVTITALLDSSNISHHLRMYVPLFAAVLFELPIPKLKRFRRTRTNCVRDSCLPSIMKRSDERETTKADLADRLETDLMDYECTIGIDGSYPNIISVYVKVEREKYQLGIDILRDILFATKFKWDPIKFVIGQMLGEFSSTKRDGEKVLGDIVNHLCFTPACNHGNTMCKQQVFLRKLKRNFRHHHKTIKQDLQNLRESLANSTNLRIHMCANLDELSYSNHGHSLEQPWCMCVKHPTICHSRIITRQTHDYLRPLCDLPHRHVIMGVGGVESYVSQMTSGIKSYTDANLPTLMVLVQYLSHTAGPLWQAIREQGLAYGFDLSVEPETGLITFELSAAPNVAKAYMAGENIVNGYIDGSTEFSQLELDSAISSLTFELVKSIDTVTHASAQSMVAYYKGVDVNYTEQLISDIATVSKDQLRDVAVKYLKPLFDVSQVRSAIVCDPSRVKGTISKFMDVGFDYKEVTVAELS